MKNAALLRKQIEVTLTGRIPQALSPRGSTTPERISCGIAAFNELLLGGLPVGVLSELVGPESSGRTTVALAFLTAVTKSDSVAAWIDVADSLDPEAAAANGADLERLLWVRCGSKSQSTDAPSVEQIDHCPTQSLSIASSPVPVRGGGSPHPRSEGRDMPQAISAMLQSHGGLYDKHVRREKKSIGTPGAPNRPLPFRSPDREEQVSSDRVPSHRAEQNISARCAEPVHERRRGVVQHQVVLNKQRVSNTPKLSTRNSWNALDQALRTADLLLQGGGFSLIVLDLGSTSAEMAWRIPLATWFRFRAACERTQVSMLLLTQHSCARSSAELVVRMGGGHLAAQNRVMTGITYSAETQRTKSAAINNVVPIKKQPQSERGLWYGEAAWVAGR